MNNIQIIDRATARKAIFMAKTLEHPERQSILAHIMEAGEAGSTVTNIYTAPRFRSQGNYMEQTVCSQHLAWLRKHGFVSTQRDGKHIIYTANTATIQDAGKAMTALAALIPASSKN